MTRTTKTERRRAKQQMLTWKKGQRYLKRLFRNAVAIELPGVPHKGGVNDWAHHLRRCDESHAAYLRLRVPLRITDALRSTEKGNTNA